MIKLKIAENNDIAIEMKLRTEMLTVVNNLEKKAFDDDFIKKSEDYFLYGDQITVIAYDDLFPVGCATLCFTHLMPTFSHPTGKRAHIMNVYTRDSHRRKGIGLQMMELLLKKAKEKHITCITLDATEDGRKLYEKLGFENSSEGMELDITY